jgi:diguanylate cyclase (GGDEF)-like protein
MESRNSGYESGRSRRGSANQARADRTDDLPSLHHELPDTETERAARQRLFDEVLASVELVLVADGAAFWREEPDHTLVLTSSRSVPRNLLDALDRHVTSPLQSIMQRWPESPLVAVPLNDLTNPIAEEIRSVTDSEGIVGLAGVPCRIPGDMLGMLIVIHRRLHPWTVRDLGLATGLAGQLATAMQNARLYSSVRSLANRLTAIHELSLRLAQLRDTSAIGEAIVAEVGRLVDCDSVRVYRLDEAGHSFRPVAASGSFVGIESPVLESLGSGQAETLPGWVAKRNEALIIPDASIERRSIVRSSSGPESLLLVPMSYGDSVQGVLVVSKEGVNKYGPDDEQALSIFGRYAAQAIVNADNIRQLEAQHDLLELQLAAERRLLELSEQLVSTLDPRRVLEQIADTIGTVVSYDRLTIYRLGEAGGIEPVLKRTDSGDAADPSPDSGALDEGLTSWVIGRGDAVCANDVGEDLLTADLEDSGLARTPAAELVELNSRRDAKDRRSTQNIIVVPLRVHGIVVGSLNLTRVGGSEAHFSEHEFELGKLFAVQASIALQNAEAHVTVATRADLDALTGLRNHGTFQRDLTALIETGDSFSLLMLDLDSFKAFNDAHGHPSGDALLQTVASSIVSATRQNDRAYRYGGDEFAVLLIGASSSHTEEVAARVRASVRESVRTSPLGNLGVHVTASIGAAHWPADGREKADLVEAADAALYRAKRLRSHGHALDPTRAGRRDEGAWSDTLLDAASDLAAASTVAQVAEATARHAAALCGATDAFVALLEREPVAGTVGGRRRASAMLNAPRLVMAAAFGRFTEIAPVLNSPDSTWKRAFDEGVVREEAGEGETRVSGPLSIGGAVVGLVAVAAPVGGSPESCPAFRRLISIASAALERASRPAGL